MEVRTHPVKSKSKIVGNAQFQHYETLDELLNDEKFGLSEAKVLELVNAQVRTSALNDVRAGFNREPSKKYLTKVAMQEIIQEVSAGSHSDVIGDEAALNALIDSRAAEIKARMEAEAPVVVVEDDDDDDDDD